MAQNIDFGDPIDFSPAQPSNTSSSPRPQTPRMDVGRAPLKVVRSADPALPTAPIQGAGNSSSQSLNQSHPEPAHKVKDIQPLFPRTQISPQPESQVLQSSPEMAPKANLGAAAPKPSFSGVPSAPAALPKNSMPQGGASKPKTKHRGIVVIAVAATLIILVLVGGYFTITSLQNTDTTNNEVNNFVQGATNTTVNTPTNNSTVTVNDPTGDPDGDALTNQEEAQYGTDMNNPDTDGDGFKDGAEVEKGFNPLGAGKLTTPQL